MHSYHDLHITTVELERTSLFDLPFGLLISCTRGGGWELMEWVTSEKAYRTLAGEYDTRGLRLDVSGHVIVDSLRDAS